MDRMNKGTTYWRGEGIYIIEKNGGYGSGFTEGYGYTNNKAMTMVEQWAIQERLHLNEPTETSYDDDIIQ